MRHEIRHPLEPEAGKLCEDLAFVRDARPEHEIECRNTIGCDNQQRGGSRWQSQLVDVANFTAAVKRQTFERSFEQGSGGEHW
jgi:hypothetical protein